jgi:hypothetical protein
MHTERNHMEKAIRQRKRGRTKYVAFAVALVAVAAVAVAWYVVVLSPQPIRPRATEYLRVVHSVSLGEFALPDASVLYLKQVGIDVTAVGGEASSILLDVEALIPGGEGDYNYYDFLAQNETWSAAIPLSNMYLELDPTTGTYPFEILHVNVHEAESENLTLHISPDKIISTAQRKLTILPSTNGHTTTSLQSDGYQTAANVSYWINLATNVTLTATPDSGYVFDYWIINAQNIALNPHTINMTQVTVAEAHFKPQP